MQFKKEKDIDDRIQSKEWRINHLYKIVDKKTNLVVFNRNPIQQRLSLENHPRKIILKARQLGITTDACIDMLDECLFKKNFNAVIIAHDKDSMNKIFKKIKVAWENLDPPLVTFMGWKVNTDNANELAINTGSTVRVTLSSRSDTVNRLHISEFGKICKKYPLKAEEIITGAFPSVTPDGRIDIESTAEGVVGQFHDLFWEAWDRKTPNNYKDFKAFFFPWTENAEYQMSAVEVPLKLRQYQQQHKLSNEQISWYFSEASMYKDKMVQEYPTTPEEAFIASSNPLFNTDALEWQKQFLKEGEKQGNWTVFTPYIASHAYAMGADVAEGVGRHSSTAVVYDFTKEEVAAVYASNTTPPDLFGHELYKMSLDYGKCLIAPERNNHGHVTIYTLRELKAKIYHEEKIGEKTTDIPTERLGWNTTGQSKARMIFALNDAISEKEIKVISKSLLTELRTYDSDDVSVLRSKDEQTQHWDRVIALAIVLQMRRHAKPDKKIPKFTVSYDRFGRPIIKESTQRA